MIYQGTLCLGEYIENALKARSNTLRFFEKEIKHAMKELTEDQKEARRKRQREAYRRRAEKKKAEKAKRNKELEKKLETMYNNPVEYQRLYVERYGLKINIDKQLIHILKNNNLKENASYFKNTIKELQEIVNKKAGTGKILLKKGQLTEIIKDDRLKGFDVDEIGKQSPIKTSRAKIHYSKTDIHLVPCAEKEQKK